MTRVKGNEHTFRRSNSVKMVCLPSKKGPTLTGKSLFPPWANSFLLESTHILEWLSLQESKQGGTKVVSLVNNDRKVTKCIESPYEAWIHLIWFPPVLRREATFMTSCFLFCTQRPFWKMVNSKKERICSQAGNKFFPFRVDLFSEGRQKYMTELSPLKV